MTAIRSILFGMSFYSLTTVLSILYIPLIVLPRTGFALFVKFWVTCCLSIPCFFAGIRYEVRGRNNIPVQPVIYAIKHQSAWETLALNLILNDVAFILKKELMSIPLFGIYLGKMDHIAVNRADGTKALKKLVEDAKRVFDTGRSVVIFPEGTRSQPGKSNPYLPGIAALYTKANCPVVPVALNAGLFWPRRKFTKNAGTIVIEFLPAIEPGLDRKSFMRKVEADIEKATRALEEEAMSQYPSTRRLYHKTVDNSVDHS